MLIPQRLDKVHFHLADVWMIGRQHVAKISQSLAVKLFCLSESLSLLLQGRQIEIATAEKKLRGPYTARACSMECRNATSAALKWPVRCSSVPRTLNASVITWLLGVLTRFPIPTHSVSV